MKNWMGTGSAALSFVLWGMLPLYYQFMPAVNMWELLSHRVGEIDIYDDLFSLSVVDERHVVAVGYHGAAYWSEDGGETWRKGKTSTERALYSVSMADRQRGWAVGQLGTILRTENGGRRIDRPCARIKEPRFAKRGSGCHRLGIVVHRVSAPRTL